MNSVIKTINISFIILLTLTILILLFLFYFYFPKVEIGEEIKMSNNKTDIRSIEKNEGENETQRKRDYKVIGLISDTHIPERADHLPPQVLKLFKERDVDHIIHTGDITSLEVIEKLEEIAPITVVAGNMDPQRILNRYPNINTLEIKGYKIGIIHNARTYVGTGKALEIAKGNDFDILVFGHTHKQRADKKDGVLLINPGSPTNPIPPFVVKPTIGLLKIKKDKVRVEFVEIETEEENKE